MGNHIVTLLEKPKRMWYNRSMSKSIDLREAAIAYHEAGHTIAETAKIFQVGKCTISEWKKKKREI